MLGSAVPTQPSLYTTAATVSPVRPSRLRGLSYLRLHSASSRSETPPLQRSVSSPVARADADRTPPAIDISAHQQTQQPPTSEGWIPTVQGRSGLSRESLTPAETAAQSSVSASSAAPGMTRNRSATTSGPLSVMPTPPVRRSSHVDVSASSASETAAQSSAAASASNSKEQQPTIRFIPHVETRSSRPSLHFSAVSRTLKTSNSVVKVGRYSERDLTSGDPNTLPVGFKSKVVSRRHCEFSCTNGQWFIKDVKSSSGTFLNHVRLSSPGVESRPYPINDGDVVQLGIDFKGGEEVIFRCVRIRVECNRGWQKSLNNFNTTAHKRLLNGATKGKQGDTDSASLNTSECSICLNPVAPCQALFVAPCSHVWHYKCVRNLIHGPSWPNFLCPNCRFVADLDAEVEQPESDGFEMDFADGSVHGDDEAPTDEAADRASQENSHPDDRPNDASSSHPAAPRADTDAQSSNMTDDELADLIAQTSRLHDTQMAAEETATPATQTDPCRPSQPIFITMPGRASLPSPSQDPVGSGGLRSPTPTSHAAFATAAGSATDFLMTPRNDAGPFILDDAARSQRSLAHDVVAPAAHDLNIPDAS